MRLAWTLVGLDSATPLPLPLEEVRRQPLDPKRLAAFFQENGFRSLTARVEQVAEAAETQRLERADNGERRWAAITELAALDAVLARATELGRLAIDTETTGLDVSRASLVGVSLAVEPGEGFYIPLNHLDEFGQKRPGQLAQDEVAQRLRPVLADPAILKIVHNGKYDLGMLRKLELEIEPVDDTILLSYVLDGASHGHGMDELAQRFLGYETIPFTSVCGKGAGQICFDLAPIDKATDYAAEDAEVHLAPVAGAEAAPASRSGCSRSTSGWSGRSIPVIADHGGHRHPGRCRAAAAALLGVRAADGDARGGGLPAGRTALHAGLAQAAGRGAVRRAEPGRRTGRKTKTGAHATGPTSWRSWQHRAMSCRA